MSYYTITRRSQVTLAIDRKCGSLRNSCRTFRFHKLPHRGAICVPKIRAITFVGRSRKDLARMVDHERWEVQKEGVRAYLSHHWSVSLTHGSLGFWNCCRSKSYIEERLTSSSIIPHMSMALNATYTCVERSGLGVTSHNAWSHLYDCIADR